MVHREYRDRTLMIEGHQLTIKGYYFPWLGAKKVALSSITSVTRVPLSRLGGKWRLWGSTTLIYFANIDIRRFHKNTGFVLDVGTSMKPFITPDDPDDFEKTIRALLPEVPFTVASEPLRAV